MANPKGRKGSSSDIVAAVNTHESKPMILFGLAMALLVGCASGPGRGPNPAYLESPDSCSRLGAAWEQHWIETTDQINTPDVFAPANHGVPDAIRATLLLPFALGYDAVALAGFGVAGSVALVPVNVRNDVRPHSCWETP